MTGPIFNRRRVITTMTPTRMRETRKRNYTSMSQKSKHFFFHFFLSAIRTLLAKAIQKQRNHTMTISKSSLSSSTSSKGRSKERTAAKRAVSFCDSVKKYGYESTPPTSNQPQQPHNTKSDGDLQASDKRRRYKRRGSKCPSMLLLSGMNLKRLLETETLSSSPESSKSNSSCQQMQMPTPQQRRLSLVSALKMSLENATIADSPNTTTALLIRRMSPHERRMTAYKLLSQVSPQI
jgi:hypothetical protein